MNEPDPQFTSPDPAPSAPVDVVASLPKRFLAAMIDDLLNVIISLPLLNYYHYWDILQKQADLPPDVYLVLTLFKIGTFLVVNGYLLRYYGQTLGKRLVGLKIVTLDGQTPAFFPLITNRYLPQWAVGFLGLWLPGFVPFLVFGDIIYIFFNEQKRCIHDLLAGTKVIDLRLRPRDNLVSMVM